MPDGTNTLAPNKGQKHHYVPVFYLSQWAGPDGRLCEFCRRYRGIEARPTFPDGTGYLRGLNTFSRLPPRLADFLENSFFQKVDNDAALVLQELLKDKLPTDRSSTSAWSRFLMTLFIVRLKAWLGLLRRWRLCLRLNWIL